jgi:hypothetical protein
MLTLDERLTNVEASLTLISNKLSAAMTDGTTDVNDDELGAVMDKIFDEIRDIENRVSSLQKQLTMVEDILNSATRKK